MSWIAGIRNDEVYKVKKRPLDPRWSQQDLQVLLGWCASAQALGWTEQRSFNVAEALVMKKKNHGITWSQGALLEDMELLISGEEHKA
jgi:hypothetical protein